MNEDAVRLALLVAVRTRERDEARRELAELRALVNPGIPAAQGKIEAEVKTAPGGALTPESEGLADCKESTDE